MNKTKYEIDYATDEEGFNYERYGFYDSLEEAGKALREAKAKGYGIIKKVKGNNYVHEFEEAVFQLSKTIYDDDGEYVDSESLEGKKAGYINSDTIWRDKYATEEEFEEGKKEREAEIEEIRKNENFDEVETRELTFN